MVVEAAALGVLVEGALITVVDSVDCEGVVTVVLCAPVLPLDGFV